MLAILLWPLLQGPWERTADGSVALASRGAWAEGERRTFWKISVSLSSFFPFFLSSFLPSFFPSNFQRVWIHWTGKVYFQLDDWVYEFGQFAQFLSASPAVQFRSVTQLCPTLPPRGLQHARSPFPSLSITSFWNLLKLMSIKSVIPFSHLCLPPFLPAFNLSQHQGLFHWVSSLHQVARVLELQFQHQSLQWIFRTNFL